MKAGRVSGVGQWVQMATTSNSNSNASHGPQSLVPYCSTTKQYPLVLKSDIPNTRYGIALKTGLILTKNTPLYSHLFPVSMSM